MIVAAIILFIIYLSIFYQIKITPKTRNFTNDIKISVVVAAKNEEENVGNLISSLQKQIFSMNNFEIIIVDDNSTDSTFEIAKKYSTRHNNIKVLRAENKIYTGKRGALQVGIDNAEYNHILITDADCIASKYFVKSYSNKFKENFDFVFGVSPITQENSIVNKIACFDNLRVHILSFSFANIGLPYSAAARSFGFSKGSFNKISGFKNTTDTLSGDDDLLLREAVKNNLRIGTVYNEDAFVFTKAKKTLSEFINQKSRHTSTSSYYTTLIKIILGVWHILNIFMIISPLLILSNINFVYLFLIKLIGDIFIVKSLMKKFSYNFSIVDIVIHQIIYEFLLILIFLKSFSMRNRWSTNVEGIYILL